MEIKHESELTATEISQLDEANLREFKAHYAKSAITDRLFFFLKEQGNLLAFCALGEVTPVYFNNETFSIYGVYDVIANIKGKGYGKHVITALKDHPLASGKSIVGFCMPKNMGFYEKCGFMITTNTTQRFIYNKDGKKITNQDGQVIFYRDGDDHFMEKVLSNPAAEVSIPTDNMW